MSGFIKVPVIKERDGEIKKEKEDVRINIRYITDYRPWMTKPGEDSVTAIFFNPQCKKPKLLTTMSVQDLDRLCEVM